MDIIPTNLRAIIIGGSVISMACLLNILQILSIPIWPFSSKLSYAINSKFLGTTWTYMDYIFTNVKKAKVTYSGDHLPKEENVLVLANHRSWSDYYMINVVAIQCERLSYIRYFIKDSLKYLPFFGWGMYLSGMLFLKRNWTEDEKKIDSTFRKLIKGKHPVWLISYLEGSRFTEEKNLECQAFCKSRDLPILNNCLFPRTKGAVASIRKLQGSHVEYLYDLTIAYYHPKHGFGVAPNLYEIHSSKDLKDYLFHIHCRRFDINKLPEDDKDLADFLINLFVEKDALLEKLKLGWTNELAPEIEIRNRV